MDDYLVGIQETRLAIMGTIQFAGGVHATSAQVMDHFTSVAVPQAKPLSPGEVLGCTSPVIENRDALVFVADGRFHLEVSSAFFFFVMATCVSERVCQAAWHTSALTFVITTTKLDSANGRRSDFVTSTRRVS